MRKFHGHAEIIFTRIYTPSAKYKSLPFCIESFSHFVVDERYSVERADLNCYIVLYSIKGEGVLEYRGSEYQVGENQVIFIDSRFYHKYRSANGGKWEFYFMLISGVGVQAYYDILFSERYYALAFFDNNIIKKFIDTMLYLDGKHSHQFELWACRQINDFLIQLSFLNSEYANFDFVEVLEYIEKNLDKKLSIDELAEVCKMSKFHFIRRFKKVYSETPYGYITRVKVNRAKTLLSSTDRTVDKIAVLVGFNDTNTFIRAFKKYTGETPLRYRDSNISHM
ncbi:MAG: AraC family transcriptional regulator [Clostridiales bacterium]|jgi:AraC-like DNA-binding protein|nr:AraC family transcriptional regulator [Clostridiales bacterium]